MAHTKRYINNWFGWALILVLSLGAVFDASAQPTTNRQQAAKAFSLFVADAGGPSAPAFVFLRNDQVVDLPVAKGNRRSDPMPWPGAATLRLAMRNPRPAAGAPVYVPVADLAWPSPNTDRALVVVVAGPSPKAFIIDDDVKSFPPNSARVINLTTVPLLVKVNQFTGELAAGKATVAAAYPDVSGLAPGAMVRYPFGLAVRRANEEPLVLNSGFQEGVPGTRTLLVVTPPAQAGSTKVRVRPLIDRPVVNQTAPAAAR